MKPVTLHNTAATFAEHCYVGPIAFKARCGSCGEPRNRHCGRCKGCPGHHRAACLKSYATGAWH